MDSKNFELLEKKCLKLSEFIKQELNPYCQILITDCGFKIINVEYSFPFNGLNKEKENE